MDIISLRIQKVTRGLDNIPAYLNPGGQVGAVGTKLSTKAVGEVINLLLGVAFSRFAVVKQE